MAGCESPPVTADAGSSAIPVAAAPIRFMRPALPAPSRWLPYLDRAYDTQWFSNFGPLHNRFATALTERYGAPGRQVLPVSNCTTGIAAALLGLEIRGRVAMPSFTFSAPAHAIVAAGCRPVFCDIDPDTWELSPAALDRLLEDEPVAAVLHVRVFGLCRDLTGIEAVCRKHGVPLLVDSAAALGGSIDAGPAIGHAGVCEIFSMHATKTFGIGEGGAIFASPEHIQRMRRVINFGIEDGQISYPGLNGKMCEVHAAIGLAVLDEIDRRIAHRAAVAAIYRQALSATELTIRPAVRPGQTAWSAYPIELGSPAILTELRRAIAPRLETKPYYCPVLHRSEVFETPVSLPATEALAGRMLCLPIYSDMSPAEATRVCEILRPALERLASAGSAL